MTRSGSASWLIPGPGPDESLQSIVYRAAQTYGACPQELWSEFDAGGRASPDDLHGPDLVRLARVVGVTPAQLHNHGLPDHPRWLAPDQRHAVCPACHGEDLAAGRPCGRRRRWANAFATLCAVHRTPLQLTSGVSCFAPAGPIAGCHELPPTLQRIEGFARAIEATLYDQVPWPKDWFGDAYLARGLVLAASLNLQPAPDFPIACAVIAPAEIDPWLSTSPHLHPALTGCPWDTFRRIADPAQRRRAFWFAGCLLVPELDSGLPRRLSWLEKSARLRRDMSAESRILADALCNTLADRAGGTLRRSSVKSDARWN